MTTEEKTATATNRNNKLDRYKLTPDELRDGSKLKAKLVSTEALFSYGSLAANASGVPGLGAVIAGLEAVVNSVDRVQRHRRRCKTLKNSWVNLVNFIHINRSCMQQECLVNILDSVAEALEVFKEYLDEWSRLSWIKSWMYRHAIGDKLDQFHQAFEEASQAVPFSPIKVYFSKSCMK
ncbi:hypothetical protein FRC01_005276 [Tulasnella sp. 417]|nr:hypothetical protein FRC01_005276 [Tulasnella sp. 417]